MKVDHFCLGIECARPASQILFIDNDRACMRICGVSPTTNFEDYFCRLMPAGAPRRALGKHRGSGSDASTCWFPREGQTTRQEALVSSFVGC